METADRIPDPFRQLGVLKKRICAGGIERAHSHVHAPKGKHSPEPLGPEVFRRSTVNGLEGMQLDQMLQKARSSH